METKTTASKQQQSSTDATNGAKSAMQSMSIGKATSASSSAASAAAADFEDISCKERFKCTGQEIFNALTQREMIQVGKTCGFETISIKIRYFYNYQVYFMIDMISLVTLINKLTFSSFFLLGIHRRSGKHERSKGWGAFRDAGRKHTG